MNLILINQQDFIAKKTVRLSGRRFKHIKEILKPSVHDILSVGEINGKIGKGKIVALTDKSVEMILDLDRNPPCPHPATLVLSLPRPIVLKRLLSSVASLGVKTVYLIQSRRVEKSYWKSPTLEESKITEQLILGLEQAKDTVLPQVFFKKRFKPFVEDEVPVLLRRKKGFVAHPQGKRAVPVKMTKSYVLFVGPEGGFIDYEIDLLKKQGVLPVSLGLRILRVETAVPVLLAKHLS